MGRIADGCRWGVGDRCRFDELSNVSEDLLIVRVEIMGFEVVIFVIYLDVKDREINRKIVEDLQRNLERSGRSGEKILSLWEILMDILDLFIGT